jgi:membrane protein
MERPDRSWLGLLRQTISQWVNHNDARLGAALAYYSVFSLGPVIVIAVAIAGLLFGADAARGDVTGALKDLLGSTGAQAINAMLEAAGRPREGIVATLIGLATLLVAAIGVVVQLKDALNTVWEVEEVPYTGIWSFLRKYILSLAGVIALGFLLLISMLATAALSAASKYISPNLPEVSLHVVTVGVSFAVITSLFAMMFKWLPDTRVHWGDVWLGAAMTAVLFETGKFLIGFYIGKQGLESTFGAAASIVIVLVWVYYSAQILLFGAEFTNVYAKRRGSRAEPLDTLR